MHELTCATGCGQPRVRGGAAFCTACEASWAASREARRAPAAKERGEDDTVVTAILMTALADFARRVYAERRTDKEREAEVRP